MRQRFEQRHKDETSLKRKKISKKKDDRAKKKKKLSPKTMTDNKLEKETEVGVGSSIDRKQT